MPDWYSIWVVHHAEHFGITEEKDLATMLSWRQSLTATEAELRAATASMVAIPEVFASPEVRFLGRMERHLVLIRKSILCRRKVFAEREEQARQHAAYQSAAVDAAAQAEQRQRLRALIQTIKDATSMR